MVKLTIPAALAASVVFLQTISAQEFTVTLYGTNFDCDVFTECDAKVNIQCQTNWGSWRNCGTAQEIRDNNNPVWPERHSYNYIASENMFWKFEILDQEPLNDQHIHTFELSVGYFFNVTDVGRSYRHNMNGKGFFHIVLAQIDTTTALPTSPTPTTTGAVSTTTMNPALFDCLGRPDGFYPHPLDCSKYIGCYGGEMSAHYQCPPPLLFDPVIGNCNFPAFIDCDLSCDGKLDGLYPHPHDCSLYIICNAGEPHVYWCPSPLLFNREIRRCDVPQNVECLAAAAHSGRM